MGTAMQIGRSDQEEAGSDTDDVEEAYSDPISKTNDIRTLRDLLMRAGHSEEEVSSLVLNTLSKRHLKFLINALLSFE
jgi:hypothetical protein